MEYVTSADGTSIAYRRTGSGPPLVLVHGTGVDHHVWDDVVPLFAESYTVLAVDRRGRGESGDADGYSIRREFEDLETIAAAVEGPVRLLGHSYGAICAVGAAPGIGNLRRLVLYEPPLARDEGSSTPPPEQRRMENLADRGEDEAILEIYWNDMRGEPDQLERLKARSDYGQRVDAAPTLPREMDGRREYRPTPDTYPAVDVPTLLLTGSASREPLKRSVAVAADLFPNSRIVELEGYGHTAMNRGPERFTSAVLDFLVEE